MQHRSRQTFPISTASHDKGGSAACARLPRIFRSPLTEARLASAFPGGTPFPAPRCSGDDDHSSKKGILQEAGQRKNSRMKSMIVTTIPAFRFSFFWYSANSSSVRGTGSSCVFFVSFSSIPVSFPLICRRLWQACPSQQVACSPALLESVTSGLSGHQLTCLFPAAF